MTYILYFLLSIFAIWFVWNYWFTLLFLSVLFYIVAFIGGLIQEGGPSQPELWR